MGKRKNKSFPQSINAKDRIYLNHRQKQQGSSPTNYVSDLFGLNDMVSEGDYLGSYTGVPMDDCIYPVQDADDL